MNAALAMAARDWRVLLRDKGTTIPMAFVPVVFLTVFTALTLVVARMSATSTAIGSLLGNARLLQLMGVDPSVALAGAIGTRLVPILLLIVPMMVAQAIATDSIAGERERGTFESLLLLPISARTIVAAKVLAAFVPGLAVGWLCQIAYRLLVNGLQMATGGPALVGGSLWWLLIVVLCPAFTAASLAAAVLVSAYAQSVRAASQLAGLAVLPVVAAVVGQGAGVITLGFLALVLATAALWALAAVLVTLASRRLMAGLAQ